MFQRASMILSLALAAPFAVGCLGDNIVPLDGKYALSLEPTLRATVYFYNGDFRVTPKLDYAKYWSAEETLRTREISIEETEAGARVTLPSAGGAAAVAELAWEDDGLTATGQLEWTSELLAAGCIYGVGSAISLKFADLTHDVFTIERIYERTFSFTAINPPSCEPPLEEIGAQLAGYADPQGIPDPIWRLFVASKLLPIELVKKTIVLRIQTVETGRRVGD